MKRIRCFVFSLFLFAAAFALPASAAETDAAPPEISASAYVLANAANGDTVVSKNADERMRPASLTKMLTALVTVERIGDLDGQRVPVSAGALKLLAGTGSSTGGLKAGETYTPRELLYLLLLCSANDAANVLAEYIAGDNASFAELMNAKAAELGMESSRFVNPHGLDEDGHYTTARDLSLLACELARNPVLGEIWGSRSYGLPETEKQEARVIKTTDSMLDPESEYFDEDVIGGKTGNTDGAGRCFTVSARRDNTGFVLVLLKCPPKYEGKKVIRTEFTSAKAMLDYAFSAYTYTRLGRAGEVIETKHVGNTFRKNVTAVLESDVWALLESDADPREAKRSVNWKKSYAKIAAPVEKGAVLGTAEFAFGGETAGLSRIVAAEDVSPNRFVVFWKKIDAFVYVIITVAGVLLLVFAVLVIRASVIRKRRAARRRYRGGL